MTTTAYAGIDGHLNFSIPKVKRKLTKDNLTRVEVGSRDAQEIVSSVERSYLESVYAGKWSLDALDTVVNKQLQESYRKKKLELKDEGRHTKDLTDQYMFLACKDPFLAYSIAKNGLQVKEKKDKILNALGNSKSGVSLWKHADVQLCFAETYPLITICKLIVFKVITGKVKSVQPCYGSETVIEPTPNYDCHISAISAKAGDPFYPKLMKSQVFFYEYTDEALPASCPRQCLPYAILTYKRPKQSAPVDHLSLKSAYRNFFRSAKDRGESGGQGALSSEEMSGYTDTAPGRSGYLNRPSSQHQRHGSGEADPRLNTSGTLQGRGRGPPLLPDPPFVVKQDSCKPWSSGQDYQPSAPYKKPLLQAPVLASAANEAATLESGCPPGPQRFCEDVRFARGTSQNSNASWSEQPHGDLDRSLIIGSPPVTGLMAEAGGVKVDQISQSFHQNVTNTKKDTGMNTTAHTNGFCCTDPQTSVNSRTFLAADGVTGNSVPSQLPPGHFQHLNVSKVQESLTESQVAMLKQVLNTSQVVSHVNLPSQQVAGDGLMSPKLVGNVTREQTPLLSPLQKPKTGKQKLSLESYRLLKRRASSVQPTELISECQNSGQGPLVSAAELQQQKLASDSAEESSDTANVNPPQIVSDYPAPAVKSILKTTKAFVKDTSQDDDIKMAQDTSDDAFEPRDNHSVVSQAPGSPCSVISSVSSVDASSLTSSLSSSLAGSVAHSPAQADPKPNTPPKKKKKKVNRMMIGYKKRRRRKRAKSKPAAEAEEGKQAEDSVICDLEDTSLSTDCHTKPESESPLNPQLKSRCNPLWKLASPPDDNDIDYNDFSYEQPHHFEVSIPDGLSLPCTLPTKRRCLDLDRFGLKHWSEAATDPRFQPSILLVRSKVDVEANIGSAPKEGDVVFSSPDSPDAASLVMDLASDEKSSALVERTEISQHDTGCERTASEETEDRCESDIVCEAFRVKPSLDDCIQESSESKLAEEPRVCAKRTSVIDSNLCDVGEIEAVIDRHMKQSHATDMYPKWPEINHPDGSDRSNRVSCSGQSSASQCATQASESLLCESGMEVSMDVIRRVAANILPYMEEHLSVNEISSTIAAILSPLPLPQPSSLPVPTSLPVPALTPIPVPASSPVPASTSSHEPASLPVPISLPVTVSETSENAVYPSKPQEDTMLSPASPEPEYDSTSIALAILHEDSDEDDIVTPQSSPAKSDSDLVPSDGLYSAYMPENTPRTTNSESAEQTAAKWLGQMAQLCNLQKDEPKKTKMDFFESVRKTLNLNITVNSVALPEENSVIKTEKESDIPETDVLPGVSIGGDKSSGIKVETEVVEEMAGIEKQSHQDMVKQCEDTRGADQNIPVLSTVKQGISEQEMKRSDKTIPVVSGGKCYRKVRDAHSDKNMEKNSKQVVVLTATKSAQSLGELNTEANATVNSHTDQIISEVTEDSCKGTGLPPGDQRDPPDILRWFQDMITPKPGEKSQLARQTSVKGKVVVSRKLERESSTDATQTNEINNPEMNRSTRDKGLLSNSEYPSKRRRSRHSVSSSPSPGRHAEREKFRQLSSDEESYYDRASRDACSSSYGSSRLSERGRRRYRSPSDSPRYRSWRQYSRDSYSRSKSQSPGRRRSGHRRSSSGSPRHGSKSSSRSYSRSPNRRSPVRRNRYGRRGRRSYSPRSSSRSLTPDSDRGKRPLYRRSSLRSPAQGRSSSSSPRTRMMDRSRSSSRSRYTRHSQGERSPSQSSGTRSKKSPRSPVRCSSRRSSCQKSLSPGPLRHSVKRNLSPSLRRHSHRVSSRDTKSSSYVRQDSYDKEPCENLDHTSGVEIEGRLSSVITSHHAHWSRGSLDKTEERRTAIVEKCDNDKAVEEKASCVEKIQPVHPCISKVATVDTVLKSGGSPVRQFETKTLDDLDSERARLLLELDDLKNSDSDSASVISHYSKASSSSHGNRKSSTVQKRKLKLDVENSVAEDRPLRPENHLSNVGGSILVADVCRSEMTNCSFAGQERDNQSGSLQSTGSTPSPPPQPDIPSSVVAWGSTLAEVPQPTHGQPECSNLQTPVVAESWSSIVCNIENEKQEVVRGHTSLNMLQAEQTLTLPGSVSESVPDMFELDCKIALSKMEKLKRKQEGQRAHILFMSPLHTWLSSFIPSSSNVYEDVLQEICRCMKLPRTQIFSELSKKARKATRKVTDRLVRMCQSMEGSSDKIKPPTLISMNCVSSSGCYYTVRDWFGTFISSRARYFNAVVDDALLTLGISPFSKVASLPGAHCSQLENRAEFYKKLWEKLNLPSYTDSLATAGRAVQSADGDIQQPPLRGTQFLGNLTQGDVKKEGDCHRSRNYRAPITASLQEAVRCDSCGKNPEIIGLNLAVKKLNEVKSSVQKATAYLKEYAGHMKIVLWNAKAFQSIRFSLDKSCVLLSSVNGFSSPIKQHFRDLAPAHQHLVKVIRFSKYSFFKSRKVQIELVISYLMVAHEILNSAILSATRRLAELQVPEFSPQENCHGCSQCYQYIHSSSESEEASDFISLNTNQTSENSAGDLYSPSEPTSEQSDADEKSQIPKFNFDTSSCLTKDILVTFERLSKTLENAHLDCSWEGTRQFEEITEKLLLPDEIEHGILYGGQGIWLQQSLPQKKVYQLISFRSEIRRIDQLLSRSEDRKLTFLQRSKRKMLNKRWNVFSIYTDKLSQASLLRLQEQAKLLSDCLLCLESMRFPEVEKYKTDEILRRVRDLLERIPVAIELCQKGLAKLEEKQAANRKTNEELVRTEGSPLGSASKPLLCGSVCEPLGGPVKTSQSDSEVCSLLEDMDPDPLHRTVPGFQDEVSVWSKGAGCDPPNVKVTYFSSTNRVLEPSDHIVEKIEPRNDHTRWALAAAPKSESSSDVRPMLVSSPRNDDTRRALATSTDVCASVYEDLLPQDVDMRRTTEQKREILKFHVNETKQKSIGLRRFQSDQNQGKPISSISRQMRRPSYQRPYKQNAAQYRSAELLRNCGGRDDHIPIVQRYPFAVEQQASRVQYYPESSYNSYPPQQTSTCTDKNSA